ncbi:hypothetical protein WJX73_006525 [Symbiochloris irregularis]|uniref:Uncharacterized protein n=1 Tax=Symbiochloris irregularis TaxID=706552 RepID=A0AAW1NZS7_9CHLO
MVTSFVILLTLVGAAHAYDQAEPPIAEVDELFQLLYF